jgi:hypothetical protein
MLIYWSTLAYVLSEFKQRTNQPLAEVGEEKKKIPMLSPGKKSYQGKFLGSNRVQRKQNP